MVVIVAMEVLDRLDKREWKGDVMIALVIDMIQRDEARQMSFPRRECSFSSPNFFQNCKQRPGGEKRGGSRAGGVL